MPFEDDAFDWVVSVDCFGYPAVARPSERLAELARVVRPGGTISKTRRGDNIHPALVAMAPAFDSTSIIIDRVVCVPGGMCSEPRRATEMSPL